MASAAGGPSGVRRGLGLLVVVALVAAAVLAGWWAARAALTSGVDEAGAAGQAADAQPVWGEATHGSVGRSLPLSTTLRQPAVPVAQNSLSGVVTSVSPGEVSQGDVVFIVGDTQVRAVQGDVPFWRDLSRGSGSAVTRGEDVEALQRLLNDLGHRDGEVDGIFGAGTEAAVKAWQKTQGREQTGVVALGELVAVPALPAVVQLGEGIVVGKTLAGGEDAVLAPTGDREFVLVVTAEQARLIPAEATVEITFEDHTWEAVIVGSELDEYGSTTFTLAAPDGGEVCDPDCGVLPNDAQVTLRSEVVIVPRVEGTTVPAAAVHSRADGSAYVVTEAGEVDVTVLGSGQGVVVVEGEGIEPGTRVQVSGGQAGEGMPLPGDGASVTQGG